VETTSAPKALGGEILPPGAHPLEPHDLPEIGGNRLTGRLTSGEFGTVYLAHGPGGELVTVKAYTGDTDQGRRTLRTEAACARRLPRTCTPALLADGTDKKPPYIVSEYVEGPSLRQFVEDLGPLAPEQLGALAVALAQALAVVHDEGLIHGDLTPANVLLAADGPRLTNFGAAAQEIPAPGSPAEIAPIPDSPGWIAPERLAGGPAMTASDVYGWARLMAYAATGHSPAEDPSVGRPAPDLTGLTEPIRRAVEAALDKDPSRRPAAATIASRLGRALEDDRTERREQVTEPRRAPLPGPPAPALDRSAAARPASMDESTAPMRRIDADMERPPGAMPAASAAATDRAEPAARGVFEAADPAPGERHDSPGANGLSTGRPAQPGTSAGLTAPAPAGHHDASPAEPRLNARHDSTSANRLPTRDPAQPGTSAGLTDASSPAGRQDPPAPGVNGLFAGNPTRPDLYESHGAGPPADDDVDEADIIPGLGTVGVPTAAFAVESGRDDAPTQAYEPVPAQAFPAQAATARPRAGDQRRRPRRGRAVVLVSVPVAVAVAVLAAVVTTTGTAGNTGGVEPAAPGGGAVAPSGDAAPGSHLPPIPRVRSRGPHRAAMASKSGSPKVSASGRASQDDHGDPGGSNALAPRSPGSAHPSSSSSKTSTPSPTPTPPTGSDPAAPSSP
jgi:serine/threonine protein kinase